MKARKYGFTLIEILMVIGIITILLGILVPAITNIKQMAQNTKQKAQINTISLAITAFKNDYGDYPESDCYGLAQENNIMPPEYTGAQMLSEALLGWDLMGFHPKSEWRSDGDCNGPSPNQDDLYEIGTNDTLYPDWRQEQNMRERVGPYLEQGSVDAVKIGDLFRAERVTSNYYGLAQDTYVICDTFGFKKVTNSLGVTMRAGAPILYYKARTNYKTMDVTERMLLPSEAIYAHIDNLQIIKAKMYLDNDDQKKNTDHPLQNDSGSYEFFYEEYIRDKSITNKIWPYRPDSYLLISAGADGEYGTEDDITNFR